MAKFCYEIITDFHPSPVNSLKVCATVKSTEGYALMQAHRISNYLHDEVNYILIRIYQLVGNEKFFLHSIKIEKINNKFLFVRSFSYQKKASSE